MKMSMIPMVILSAVAISAAGPLGSISSYQPFELNGSTVAFVGVPWWPITPGDVITTRWAPATLLFRDGSRVVISDNSKVRIEAHENRPVLRLLEGFGRYTLPAKASLTLFVTEKPVATKPSTGGFISSNPEPAPATRSATAAAVTDKDPDKDKPPHPSPHK